MTKVLIGCTSWNLPREAAHLFPAEGSHLQRYASRLPAVEINSSFYRSHRPSTYARWSASVPPAFLFSVKAPKRITHVLRLVGAELELEDFLMQAGSLGSRLGCLLVQLPPSFACDLRVAKEFFDALRSRYSGDVAFEPRHPTWFTDGVEELLVDLRIARVAADPAPAPGAGEPAAWRGLVYYRLHGSPHVYYSAYGQAYLSILARRLSARAGEEGRVWCIFDNTAVGAAWLEAIALLQELEGLDASGRRSE